MRCPHLTGTGKRRCTAVQGLVVLSSDELDAYCDRGGFRQCPVFLELERLGRKVPLQDYGRLCEEEDHAQKGAKHGH